MSLLTATRAGIRHRRRWIFRDLDLTIEPGELVAIVGPPGSGRTTVLLALAHVPGVAQPEPSFTVAEHVRERLALLGRPARDAAQVPLHGLDPREKGWELTPYRRQVLGIVLARLENPRLVALDGIDEGLDADERADLWRLVGELTGDGIAVVVTAREVDPALGATVVALGAPAHGPQAAADAAPPGPDMAAEEAAGHETAVEEAAQHETAAEEAAARETAVEEAAGQGADARDGETR